MLLWDQRRCEFMVAYGLGPYFQQKIVRDIIEGHPYFTLHFDETVSAQVKKHGFTSMLLVREIKWHKSDILNINNVRAC